MSVSEYDQIKNNMQKMYDAAQAKLQDLERERQEVLKNLELLGNFVGSKKTYSLETLKATSSKSTRGGRKAAAPRAARAARAAAPAAVAAPKKAARVAAKPAAGKKARIKEETIREMVCKYLKESEPNSMTPVEIFSRLLKDGMPDTPSFRTRVYSKLGVWANDGVIQKVGRGVYKSAK